MTSTMGQRQGNVTGVGGKEATADGEIEFEGLDLEAECFGEGSVLGNVSVEVVACAVVDHGVVVFIVDDVTGHGDVVFKGGELELSLSEFVAQSHPRYCCDYRVWVH